MIKNLQRHRRTRAARTKEFSKSVLDDLDGRQRATGGPLSVCPVCQNSITIVPGGETLEEHVDRCLLETAASEAHRLEQMEIADRAMAPTEESYSFGGETRIRLTSITGFAGSFLLSLQIHSARQLIHFLQKELALIFERKMIATWTTSLT